MKEEQILEPISMYNKVYKDGIKENASKYFDELVKKSKIDVNKNQEVCKKYDNKITEIEQLKKSLSKRKGIKGLFIALSVILFIVTLVFLILGIMSFMNKISISLPGYASLIIAIASLGIGIFLVVYIVKKINPLIKNDEELKAKKEKEASEFKNEASVIEAPLNALFDFNMCSDVIKMTTPLIQLDKYFDMKKYQFMNEKYGLEENKDENSSTEFVISGSIQGNPFLVERTFNTELVNKTYTGSITIHWTTRNAKGELESHSQTLTASVTKPAPSYWYDTVLIYGNEAAPNLNFSRVPSSANSMDEKKLEKYVSKQSKKLDKIEEKAMMDDDPSTNFTKMGNDEFDVLFGATDRNNEREFRLLFTPLAQKNELDLIKSKEPYGDDFKFFKRGMINIISSMHANATDIYSNPQTFISYSHDISKAKFIEYTSTYFQSLYFDLAPLISIPLYQQMKPHEFIYKKIYERNFTSYESESMANSMNISYFAPKESKTSIILKTQLIEKNEGCDKLLVRGYSYNTKTHVEYIPKLGGDGRMHDVPVEWIEYIPIYKDTIMEMTDCNTTRQDFNNAMAKNDNLNKFLSSYSLNNGIIYQRGLLAFILNENNFSNEAAISLKKSIDENFKK